jgi:hypothetical protein
MPFKSQAQRRKFAELLVQVTLILETWRKRLKVRSGKR